MTREKYLAQIDQVLIKSVAEQSKGIGERNSIKYSKDLETAGLIQKIAFDVYRVENDPYRDLWTLSEIDGSMHLVRSNDSTTELEANGDWSAISDYDMKNVTLAYKDRPIARFSSSSYGFSQDDVFTFKEALLDRVSTDSEFVKLVFSEQPESKRTSLVNSFPELSKYL